MQKRGQVAQQAVGGELEGIERRGSRGGAACPRRRRCPRGRPSSAVCGRTRPRGSAPSSPRRARPGRRASADRAWRSAKGKERSWLPEERQRQVGVAADRVDRAVAGGDSGQRGLHLANRHLVAPVGPLEVVAAGVGEADLAADIADDGIGEAARPGAAARPAPRRSWRRRRRGARPRRARRRRSGRRSCRPAEGRGRGRRRRRGRGRRSRRSSRRRRRSAAAARAGSRGRERWRPWRRSPPPRRRRRRSGRRWRLAQVLALPGWGDGPPGSALPRPARARRRRRDQRPEDERIADVRVDDQGGAEPEDDFDGDHGRTPAAPGRGRGSGRRPRPRSRGRRPARASRGGELGAGAARRRGARPSAAASAAGSSGATRRAAPSRGDLGEAADGAQDQRLAEGEAGVEDAGVLGVAVGQDDRSARRKIAGISASSTKRVRKRTRPGASRGEARAAAPRSMRGLPTIQSSAPSQARGRRAAGCRGPCRGAAGRRRGSPGPRRPRARPGSGRSSGRVGQVVEGAVGDHPHPLRLEAHLLAQARGRPCSEWAMTASIAAEERGGRLPAGAREGRGGRM